MKNTYLQQDTVDQIVKVAESLIKRQLSRIQCIDKIPQLPMYTKNREWIYGAGWSNGFCLGNLLTLYCLTGDKFYLQEFDKTVAILDYHYIDPTNQDIGYIFYFSYALGYEITRKELYKEKALKAASMVLDCMTPRGFLQCNWMPEGVIGIDQQMNCLLLLWAWKVTRNDIFREASARITNTTLKYLVSEVGTSYEYVTLTEGDIQSKPLAKNAMNSSDVWMRGHAWGVYGLIEAAIQLENEDVYHTTLCMLSLADSLWIDSPFAATFLKQDGLQDTSASIIMASATLKAADTFGNTDLRSWGHSVVTSLLKSDLLNIKGNSETQPGLLANVSYPKKILNNPGESSIWGDYFLLEFLYRLKVNIQ